MNSSSRLRWLVLALRLVLGVVFVYAAWTKLKESYLLFAMSIDSYQLLPEWAVLFIARTLPWFELALGLLLIAGVWLRAAATLTAGLLLFFFGVMLRSYFLGLGIDCGCFGVGEALSVKTLVRDGLLLAMALGLAGLAWLRLPSLSRTAALSAADGAGAEPQ